LLSYVQLHVIRALQARLDKKHKFPVGPTARLWDESGPDPVIAAPGGSEGARRK